MSALLRSLHRNLDVLRNFAAPVLAEAWPDAKPFIEGGLAIWATHDAWKPLRSEDTDTTGKTIAVTRAAASAVNALLGFQSASPAADIAGVVATSAIGAADTIYKKRAAATKKSPEPVGALAGAATAPITAGGELSAGLDIHDTAGLVCYAVRRGLLQL